MSTVRGMRLRRGVPLGLLFAAVVLLCLYAYRALLAQQQPIHADEAGHALPAARMALALRHGDLGGFLAATRREVLWRYFHPWFITPFFLDFASGHVAQGQSVLCLGSTGLLPHLALTWRLLERDGREPQVDLLLFPDGAGHRSGYPPEMRPEYDPVLRQALTGGRYARVVTLEFGEGSSFLPDWMEKWDRWGQNYVRLMETRAGWVLCAERAFPGSRARVRVYARGEPASGKAHPACSARTSVMLSEETR